MNIREIRVVMDDGTEIVMGRAYVRELSITHNSGYRPFMDAYELPGTGSVDVVIRLRVPGEIWRSYHEESTPPARMEIERPEMFLLENPKDFGE